VNRAFFYGSCLRLLWMYWALLPQPNLQRELAAVARHVLWLHLRLMRMSLIYSFFCHYFFSDTSCGSTRV